MWNKVEFDRKKKQKKGLYLGGIDRKKEKTKKKGFLFGGLFKCREISLG